MFTFCNKLDRPSLSPFELIDQIERDFGLQMIPVVWPIGDGEQFQGVLDRDTKLVHLFERGDRTKRAIALDTMQLDDPLLPEAIGESLYAQLLEDVEVLEGLIEPLDMAKVHAGVQSPMFFGSAMVNFGVELFLQRFLSLGQGPAPRKLGGTTGSSELAPEHPEFTGFCFKLQANLDPRHRDRLAYIRIVSGRFEKGMKVNHSRMKGRQINLTQAQQLFAQDRESVVAAYPGDVIGLNNPGIFAIGDTIYTGE
jgi:peptide chain release factor 3